MFGKCDRKDCRFSFDDAEHMEDAITKLRAHYRVEHPTKAFYEDNLLGNTEVLNLTSDEAVTHFTGPRWRERLANGELQERHVIHACTQIVRRHHRYNEAAVQGVIALAAEHGQELQPAENNPPEEEMFIDVDPDY